jgi:hypothetical protein
MFQECLKCYYFFKNFWKMFCELPLRSGCCTSISPSTSLGNSVLQHSCAHLPCSRRCTCQFFFLCQNKWQTHLSVRLNELLPLFSNCCHQLTATIKMTGGSILFSLFSPFLENRSDIPYSSSPSVPIYFHSGYISDS